MSLRSLKLSSSKPEQCARPGCDKLAAAITCAQCCEAPTVDFSGALLPDVRYCSPEHQVEDLGAHKALCEQRRWVRDVGRIGTICESVCLPVIEATRDWALDFVEYPSENEEIFVTRNRRAGRPFSNYPRGSAPYQRGLSIFSCVTSIEIYSFLLAYLTKDIEVLVQELSLKPVLSRKQISSHHRDSDGPPSATCAAYHEVVRISSQNTPEDGLIIDPSYLQFAFDQPLDSWSQYKDRKICSRGKQSVECTNFGQIHENRMFELGRRGLSLPDALHNWVQETGTRAMNRVMFEEIEVIGGPLKLFSLNKTVFDVWHKETITRLELGLKYLRPQFFVIDEYVGDEEKLEKMEKIADVVGGSSHDRLLEIFYGE